ncbi:MAG: hypothetical protein IJA12_02710 [Oscillospiraceae bacterium]|nr:hypothetical protein [Oscillospiraceae bacterium]
MKKKKNEYKPQRHKHLIRNMVSVLGTLVLAYFFIVVGYSVAKPFGEIGEIKTSDLNLETDSIADQQLESVESSETPESEEIVKAYWLRETDIESAETLEGLINIIGNKYNMVVVPLKIEGGKLNYATSYEEAILAEVGNELELTTIYNTIKNKGYTPVASINAMQDNLYPKTNKNSGFVLKSNKSLWLDTQNEKGKPWLNPASTETKQYLQSITGEIAKAGFRHIICTNMEYPSFSKEALDDIGGIVTETDRYLDLVDNVNNMTHTAQDRGSTMWLEISAHDMLTGVCEVFFKPIMLDTEKYVVKIDLSKFSKKLKINGETIDFSKMSTGEKIETICSEIEKTIYKSSYIPEITSSSLNMKQKQEIEDTFDKMGYDSYILR